MDRKTYKLLHFLPLTPLHVSHTHAQTDTHSSTAGWRNPNVLISGDKQRQGEHWAALEHSETSLIRGMIETLLKPHLRPLKLPSSSSPWSAPPVNEPSGRVSTTSTGRFRTCRSDWLLPWVLTLIALHIIQFWFILSKPHHWVSSKRKVFHQATETETRLRLEKMSQPWTKLNIWKSHKDTVLKSIWYTLTNTM